MSTLLGIIAAVIVISLAIVGLLAVVWLLKNGGSAWMR